jgi:hypothetical protein
VCVCVRVLNTAEVGDLDKVKRVVKVVGFVNCVDGFKDQPMVINGVSDLLGEIFGDKGKVRACVQLLFTATYLRVSKSTKGLFYGE